MAVLVPFAGCNGHDHGDSGSGSGEVDVYSDGLRHQGDEGHFAVALTSDPSPLIKGIHRWTLEVTDAAGEPVVGATVTVSPWMPDHNHGAQRAPEIEELDGGIYRAEPVDLHMAGRWETTITVTHDELADEVRFNFAIPET